MSDIYHMIVDLIKVWKPETRIPTIAKHVEDFLRRCEDGDEMYELVEEFIYGDKYAPIRHAFSE